MTPKREPQRTEPQSHRKANLPSGCGSVALCLCGSGEDHLTADLEHDRPGPAGEAAPANGVADEAPAKAARRAAR